MNAASRPSIPSSGSNVRVSGSTSGPPQSSEPFTPATGPNTGKP